MSEIVHVTDDSFEHFAQQYIASGQKVLIDFWASWCAPCRALSPVLEALAAELGDQLVVAKVDVDENKALASQFAIRSIPCLVLFENGQQVDVHLGNANRAQLLKFIQRA